MTEEPGEPRASALPDGGPARPENPERLLGDLVRGVARLTPEFRLHRLPTLLI